LVIIVGCVLSNIVYFFLHFIARLSNISIGSSCTLNCDACKNRKADQGTCGAFMRYWHRHSLAMSINIVAFLAIVFLLILHFCVIEPDPTESTDSKNNTKGEINSVETTSPQIAIYPTTMPTEFITAHPTEASTTLPPKANPPE
jgi:hypothetical protein